MTYTKTLSTNNSKLIKRCNRYLSTIISGGLAGIALALIYEVNLRRARLVLRWATVSWFIPGAGHIFRYVTNQPPKANSAFHPSGIGK